MTRTSGRTRTWHRARVSTRLLPRPLHTPRRRTIRLHLKAIMSRARRIPATCKVFTAFFSEGSAASSQKNPIFPNRKSISTKSASSNSRSQIDVNDLVAEVMGAVAASSQSQSQHTMGSSRRMERMESLNSQSERSADSFYSDGSTDASSSEIESPGGVANYQC